MSVAKKSISPAYETWSVEGHSMRVEYTPALMEDIRSAVVENFLAIPRGGIEIGGVLFGRREGTRIQLVKQRRIACEYANGPSFVLSERDEAALAQMLDKQQQDPEMGGLEPVGWYVSHTRGELSLSAHDLRIYNRYFPESWQATLVLKPAKVGHTRGGFFFRERDGSVRAEAPYRELSLLVAPQVRRIAAGADLEDTIVERAGAEPQRLLEDMSSTLIPAPPAMIERHRLHEPEAAGPSTSVWNWLAAFGVAILLIAALAVALGSGKLSPVDSGAVGPTQYNLGLRLSSSGDRLLVEWDQRSEVMREAHAGSISIVDGGSNSETIPLDSARLRHGNVIYVRRTGNVEVRLKIFRKDEPALEEMVQFVGPPVPVAQVQEAAQPIPAPSELEKDAERMREELRRLNAEMSRLQSSPRAASDAALPVESAPSPPEPKPRLMELPAVSSKSRSVETTQAPIPEPPPVLGQAARSIGSVPQSLNSRVVETPPPQPLTGRAIWTGELPRNGLLSLDGK
ncbi:MAG: hypothetical protein ACRD7E_22380, partial [Bryobacteraceae bacterium]